MKIYGFTIVDTMAFDDGTESLTKVFKTKEERDNEAYAEYAVERLEYNGHIMIERCLADCCEVIANNTDSDEEAFERIIEDGDMMYPLSEWGRKAQFEIYKQWLAHFDRPIIRTTEAQMERYIAERRNRA